MIEEIQYIYVRRWNIFGKLSNFDLLQKFFRRHSLY